MQITNSAAAQYHTLHNLSNKSSPANKTNNVASGKTNSDTVNISSAGRSASEKLQLIANKYDVTNISTAERIAMSEELNEHQLMPEGVMLFMVAPLSMNEDIHQKSDYLTITRESIEVASKMGVDAEQLKLMKQQLEILEQLKSISNSGA